MAAINPNYVPTITPGNLFTRLTTDTTLNIRWLTPSDPAFYEVINRPIADEVLRTLIVAKAVDGLNASLGHVANHPFLVQPTVTSGTDVADVPMHWIWGMSASIPKKWIKLRLAKIKRVSGYNSTDYTGYLRLIFTAQTVNSAVETSLFTVDYHIDSVLTYQTLQLAPCTSAEETNAISNDEAQTVAGSITFRTLDASQVINSAFLDLLAPPVGGTDGSSYYDSPTVYEVSDSVAGGSAVTDDFSVSSLRHGTGLVVDDCCNQLPALDSDAQSWINSFNYPFDRSANLLSTTGIQIPLGLFREFMITAPAGDEPTGVSSGLYFPVWVSRIELVGPNHLRWYFATHNTTESETGGGPSLVAIEFAAMDLNRSYQVGDVVEIYPLDNLQLQSGASASLYQQHFGRGHAVLSSVWESPATDVADFFSAFSSIVDNPQDISFTQASTRISSFGLSRVPKYSPTVGQGRALQGSTSRLSVPVPPSQDNRYVTEQDQGLGNLVDLESLPGITPVVGIERYGSAGSLCHKIVKLIVLADQVDSSDPANFYDTKILPRLRALLGRDPVFGDFWYNGTRLTFFNGDAWQD